MNAPLSSGKSSTPMIAWVVLAIALSFFTYKAARPHPAVNDGPDFAKFGSIPVLKSGRIKPLDTLSRNQLLAISGKGELSLSPEDSEDFNPPFGAKESRGKWKVERNAWLAEALFSGRGSAQRPLILVENGDVKALFGKQEELKTKRFPAVDIIQVSEEVSRLAATAQKKEKDRVTTFDRQVTQLDQKIRQFLGTSATIQPPGETSYALIIERMPEIFSGVKAIVDSQPDPSAVGNEQNLSPDQRREFAAASQLISAMRNIDQANDAIDIRPVPPKEAGGAIEDWRKFGSAALDPARADDDNSPVLAWAKISDGYRAIPNDNGASFNAAVDDYLALIDSMNLEGTGKAKIEFWFNGFAPFANTLPFYVIAGLLVLASWIVMTKPLNDAAFKLMVVLFIVHTIGIALRVYLSGRPPVTNLYSSSVFIGWGAIGVSLLLERWVLKNGIGSFVAAVIGVLTLIIARQLSFDGDTMEVKQAVLDSNFWLANNGYKIMIP